MSKKDLSDDLEQLLGTGLFANVDANVTPSKDGYAVEFVFREKIWPQVQSFRVSGSSVLHEVELEVLDAAKNSQNCTVRVLAAAKNIVEGYYTSKGLTFGTISVSMVWRMAMLLPMLLKEKLQKFNIVFLMKTCNQC